MATNPKALPPGLVCTVVDCYSIEPGIYLPEFGVRNEINMLVRSGGAEVTGRMQPELVII
jgi:Xaa-Pro aminopeptidase